MEITFILPIKSKARFQLWSPIQSVIQASKDIAIASDAKPTYNQW